MPERGKDVINTWGKRCNKLIFFTKNEVAGYPTVGLNTSENGNYDLTNKIFKSFQYLYEYELDKFDWFLKADTDTYIIVENVRYMLSGYNPSEPIYFGQHFKVGMHLHSFIATVEK